MNYTELEMYLLWVAREEVDTQDPSHDIQHCMRVLKNCEILAKEESWDMEILLPAALFHDIVNYPKDDIRAHKASDESAERVAKLLEKIPHYPSEKIAEVAYAVKNCSYSKNLEHNTLESKILQDADFLESIWAISIMRTFASAWTMKKSFFHLSDPFCEKREPEPLIYAFDLFPQRLLKVQGRMLTNTGKKLAEQRTEFLYTFLEQTRRELCM